MRSPPRSRHLVMVLPEVRLRNDLDSHIPGISIERSGLVFQEFVVVSDVSGFFLPSMYTAMIQSPYPRDCRKFSTMGNRRVRALDSPFLIEMCTLSTICESVLCSIQNRLRNYS